METMQINNHKQTVISLLQEGESILQRSGLPDHARNVQSARLDAEQKKSPVIMFYGLYNAGKSTLINALCKKEIAPTGDVPTTDKIQTVPWEGYTLIDTPGIDAHTEHTAIAEHEILQSDVILFVMDNADTFDNVAVYQAIVDILKKGKPLAIIINQKNADGSEDPNISVPEQSSIRTVREKVASNLEVRGRRNQMQIAGKLKHFLGIFPVNALVAYEAAGREPLHSFSGLPSLCNALNGAIRQSEAVYMLQTPLTNLQNSLREAIKQYQIDPIYGEKQDMAKNREALLASRQRLHERLMADGLRKIEAILEDVKAAVTRGQPVEGVDRRISETLNTLLKEAAEQEHIVLQNEIKLEAMPDYRPESSGETGQITQNDNDSAIGDLAQIASFIIDIAPIPIPVPVPMSVIVAAIRVIIHLFSGKTSEDAAAARSQEQLANYYKWLNELRDQEIKIKAVYEKSVNDFLTRFYEPQLEKIDQALAEVDSGCAEHTKNLRSMEELLLQIVDELVALSAAM